MFLPTFISDIAYSFQNKVCYIHVATFAFITFRCSSTIVRFAFLAVGNLSGEYTILTTTNWDSLLVW